VLGVAVFVTCKYPIGKNRREIHWKIGSLEKREKRKEKWWHQIEMRFWWLGSGTGL
jgi:hypothetical protein